MKSIIVTTAVLFGACAASPTGSVTSAVQSDPLRWPVGSYSCVTQYSTLAQARSTRHVAKATYVVAEDLAAEAEIGDGTVVLTGRYEELPLTPPLVAAAFTETWRVDPKLDVEGNASFAYDAQFDDLRQITGARGTFFDVSDVDGFLGFDDYDGALLHFPGGAPGGSVVGLTGVEAGDTFSGPQKFGRNWHVQIRPGVFQQFYDQECVVASE